MIVCITEKPSVARDIAEILGARSRHDGYFEGNGYQVTWTFGHLCTLKEPADYSDLWKRWSLAVLPMIPPRFGIKLIDQASIVRQFGVIESLIKNADEVINCGDAGQEGELIQRWVMQKANIACPVKRLWISSLTDEAIREGFNGLQPGSAYDNLYHAGLCRAIGDWILGMNATRLYSLKYSSPGKVLSIGRVQTPTLALIVKRHLEIANFTPTDFWELKTVYRETTFNATSGRYDTEDAAQEALQRIVDFPFTVKSVTQKQGKEFPPRLFDLTSLQVECNRRWGWTADDTLSLIQSLYEKKVTTYPRVDTTYLPDDIYPKVPDTLRRLTPYAALVEPLLAKKLPKSKKVFDNSKVTDHHAIIPTGVAPSALVDRERLLYHLIAKRFIAAFYPDCLFEQTTVLGEVNGVEFKATGKVVTVQGWRVVYEGDKVLTRNAEKDKNDEEATLPHFVEGESGPHSPSLQKKTTQPPKYYTEGTLLRAMESAGNTVDDEELREAMKENGIGRPSTRANIIETLFKRKYIYRERKSIMASQAGIDLINLINEPLLKSASLTGLWERKLRQIERGEYSSAEFIEEMKTLINEVTLNVLQDNSSTRIVIADDKPSAKTAKNKRNAADKKPAERKPRITRFEQITCPLCKKGHILKGRTAYGCSEYASGCSLRLNFDQYPADLTPARLNALIKKMK
ncbi:MAG: DNA topoisomerase 3 [Muribaculaceae bacterium]|nr:DNA topoisomerase 3 [Muribaculaceae bacterium]